MAKVVKFPGPEPVKFGLQKAQKKKRSELEKHGQLNLFQGGRVIKLGQLSTFEEALMLDEQGDRINAKNLYHKAIEEGECLADAYCNVGILESYEGNHSRAIDNFTRALKEDPRHYESHYNLANLYAEVGNYNLAKVHYTIAIELEPSYPNSYFNLGLTLAVTKDFNEAVEALRHFTRLSPADDHKQVNQLIDQLSSLL
ncbi:MAG: tetratricopeptide repeat protein [Cyclobacteriaceae bacterium]|nr:tetratricopeptide repeat protein [Cyclobacteriaceae bacterium]